MYVGDDSVRLTLVVNILLFRPVQSRSYWLRHYQRQVAVVAYVLYVSVIMY